MPENVMAVDQFDLGDAGKLATMLRLASPRHAEAFALAMHERACMGADEHHCMVWHEVMHILRDARPGALDMAVLRKAS